MKNTGIFKKDGLREAIFAIADKRKLEMLLGQDAEIVIPEIKVKQKIKKGKLSDPKLVIVMEITGFQYKQGCYKIVMKKKIKKLNTSKKFFNWFFAKILIALYKDLQKSTEVIEHFRALKRFFKKKLKVVEKNYKKLDKGIYYHI